MSNAVNKRALVVAALLLASCGAAVLGRSDRTPPPADFGRAPAPAPAPAAPPGPAPMPEPVTLADRPDAGPGEKLYVEKCIMCHGPNGMGTGLLARRSDQPDLEKRDNLASRYVILAARAGIGNMPAIPRGEVSDEQMALIAEYLAAGPHGVKP